MSPRSWYCVTSLSQSGFFACRSAGSTTGWRGMYFADRQGKVFPVAYLAATNVLPWQSR